MEAEVARVISRALFVHRSTRICFVVALASRTLPVALDTRAENLTLEGTVSHVRDGDTIEVGPIAIRLQGIAAPEGNEPGGDIATDAMRDLVLGKDLRCDLTGDRSHDRVIGVCFLDDGRLALLLETVGFCLAPFGLCFLGALFFGRADTLDVPFDETR